MNNASIFENLKKAEQGAKLSIIAYLLLSTAKILSGYFFHSTGLIADGVNNATDFISSLCVLIGLRISRRPVDKDHRYGHFRAEIISSLISSFIMFYAGIQVVIYSFRQLYNKEFHKPDQIGLIVALVSTIIMLLVFYYNYSLSKKLNSASLKAVAFDNLSDAFVSLGTMVGIIGTTLGIWFADGLAALIVGIIIIYTAFNIFRESTHILTDGIEATTITEIETIVNSIDGVIEVKDVKGRSHGLLYFIDVTVTVNPELNVRDSHDITVHIEEALKNKFFACETLVHLEPAEKKDKIEN
ncbi:MAG: cation diffusion facilitator family transporter [Gemella sp.]|nr:cation diffusion facilitator family transporter [Gemella sp.]